MLSDLRFAIRSLLRRPGFTAVVVLTLALGIGANSAIFSIVNGVLLRALPYREPERLVALYEKMSFGREEASLPDFRDWRDGARSFEQMAAIHSAAFNMSGTGEPERVMGARATPNFFVTMGVAPLLGRGFLAHEEVPRGTAPVVLSEGFWRRRFGASTSIVGQSISLSGIPFTVVGVMPNTLTYPAGIELYIPLRTDTTRGRRADYLTVVGRLKRGVTAAQAQAELATIAGRLSRQYPESNTNVGIALVPMHEEIVGRVQQALLVFMGAVGLVLLIACANVANLMLARAATREREIAVRSALGAGRGRLLRQLLTESVVLSLVGGALGLLLAVWGVAAIQGANLEALPRTENIGVDGRVMAFTLLLSLLTGVAFGLAPALRLARGSLQGSLRTGARGVAGGAGVRELRGMLVVAEVGLALVLLVGAGLLIRSFDRLQRVEPGYDPSGVITMRTGLPRVKYADPERIRAFYGEAMARVSALPGVQSASLSGNVPTEGPSYLSFAIGGQPAPPPGNTQDAQTMSASADYFRTFGIPLTRGRTFSAQDGPKSPDVGVVNEEMVRRYYGGRDPIGSRITLGDPADTASEWYTIVGVVGDVKQQGLDDKPYAQLYVLTEQNPSRAVVLSVRTSGDPMRLAPALRRAIRDIDSELPVYDVLTMEQRLSKSVARPRVTVMLLGIFAAVALTLAGIGIYGVVSYGVEQRTREIGVRMALGARPADVLQLVVRQGMLPAAVGIVVGLAAALALSRLLSSMLFAVSTTDPLTYAGVALFLGTVAFAATYLPARRATRVHPTQALAQE